MGKKMTGDDVRNRIGRLAFGRANDAVKLVFLDPDNRELIDKLDLSMVSEVKRGGNGAVEVKLLNEVALMPRSFVEQACARCSVAGSKLWFNCNPEGPNHWFYLEWVKKSRERRALHLHFTLEDNPALSRRVIARYRRMYSGVFYRRFILGEWVASQGRIYDFFDETLIQPEPQGEMEDYGVSCDYGTANPASFGFWGLRAVVVDPSAASFMEALRREGLPVVKADNDVLKGIRLTADLLKAGRLVICEGCGDAIREFGLYSWDEKREGRDAPIKQFDHAMDDIRYFAATVAAPSEESFFAATFVER